MVTDKILRKLPYNRKGRIFLDGHSKGKLEPQMVTEQKFEGEMVTATKQKLEGQMVSDESVANRLLERQISYSHISISWITSSASQKDTRNRYFPCQQGVEEHSYKGPSPQRKGSLLNRPINEARGTRFPPTPIYLLCRPMLLIRR